MSSVPVLLYHSISEAASPFALTRAEFRAQLDAVVESGLSVWTVSDFVAERTPGAVITFDDGFADFAEQALPALAERGLRATLYVTTGFVGRPGWLDWPQLRELAAAGIEIGAHTHTHPHLDTLTADDALEEITCSKWMLEDELGQRVETFAYPHGYSSPTVRALVREAGFSSACAVRNTLSSADDDPFALARLTVHDSTTVEDVADWLRGDGPPLCRRERVATKAWRAYRRTKALAAG